MEGQPHATSPGEIRGCGAIAPGYGWAAWDPLAGCLHPYGGEVKQRSRAGACLLVPILLCFTHPGAAQADEVGREVPLSPAFLEKVPLSLLAHSAVGRAAAESNSFSSNHRVSLCSDSD